MIERTTALCVRMARHEKFAVPEAGLPTSGTENFSLRHIAAHVRPHSRSILVDHSYLNGLGSNAKLGLKGFGSCFEGIPVQLHRCLMLTRG